MATKKTVPMVEVENTADELLAIESELEQEARALPDDVVVPLRINLKFARINVISAASAVLGGRKAIENKVKEPNWKAVNRLKRLVDSTRAASRALRHVDKTSTYEADVARLWPLRSSLLSMAEVLAAAGLVSTATVEAIRAGTGNLDAARDLIDLADLFTKNARKLSGKMGPITKADLV